MARRRDGEGAELSLRNDLKIHKTYFFLAAVGRFLLKVHAMSKALYMRNEFHRQIFTVAVFAFGALFFYALVSCAGPKERKIPERVDQREIFPQIADLAEENPTIKPITELPRADDDKPFSISLFVDQTQSMRGYIPDANTADFYKNSNFVAFLRALGHQAELNLYEDALSFGSGLPPGAAKTELPRPVELIKPDHKDYNLLNNDYATLMAEILRNKSNERISLIVTDGVQSHESTAGGSLMGATAGALKKWMAAGGHLEILLTTAPFKGKYFSEELRPTVKEAKDATLNVAVANRPFVVFVLIPNDKLLEEWDSFKKRDRLKDIEFVAYRLPQAVDSTTMPLAEPAIAELSMQDSKTLGFINRHNKPYDRLDNLVADAPWSQHLYSALIYGDALTSPDRKPLHKVPVFIDISAPADSKEAFGLEDFKKFLPTLSTYEKIPAPGNSSTLTSNTPAEPDLKVEKNILDRALNQNSPDSPEKIDFPAPVPAKKNWKETASLDIRAIDPALPPITSTNRGKKQLRLCYMVPWDSSRDLLCVLRMEAAKTPVEPHQIAKYSTKNDSSPDELSKVYNLATLMDQLTKNETKTARPTGFVLHLRSAK
ncbi:MAG: hypothetical protein B9S30_06720 [Verrucomicrobiia bacterium Tous-C5FEB]|nr:MAG: hypothetical protein B9S30_06720 [Verrucomicrobiae bacterium Tous-C5FEB]